MANVLDIEESLSKHLTAVIDVTPKMAAQWLDKYNFGGQRKLNGKHVRFLADVMERAEFDGGEQVRFVVVRESGKRILVNGQHRLSAVAVSGFPQQIVVTETKADTIEEAATIYARVDRGMNRSMAEVLKAMGVHEAADLTYTQAGMVSAAGPLLETMFLTGAQTSGSAYETKSADARARYVMKHADAARTYFDMIEGGEKRMSRLLQKASVVAVGLATVEGKDSAGKADEFWRGIAHDDGLRAKDPRKTAIRFLEDSRGPGRDRQVSVAHGMEACWNAWYKGTELSFVRLPTDRRPVLLLGTRYRPDLKRGVEQVG